MSMYTATPCDECGGPTIELKFGSIWCSAEDPHPGGHFVTRVAFERSPNSPIKSRGIKPQTSATASKVSAPSPRFGSGGYDDFVKGSK